MSYFNFNTPTPLQKYKFRSIEFLVKRDDFIHKELSGNKARKIFYYIDNIPKEVNSIVSYGSIQSNAMFSISYFARVYNLKFYYYANHIPSLLKDSPKGNLKYALQNGMILKEGYENIIKDENTLFIKEGIAQKEAYYGVEKLALELEQQLDKNSEYNIFLPSGTGVSALFLSKALIKMGAKNMKVYTTPTVGDSSYLKKQFFELEEDSSYFPTILDSKKKYHYGKLYREFYHIWLELQKELNLEFDLLYDPKGWITLLEHNLLSKNLVYIHQGGLLGNETMLERYKRKYGDIYEDNRYK